MVKSDIPTILGYVNYTSKDLILYNLNLLKVSFRRRAPDLSTIQKDGT